MSLCPEFDDRNDLPDGEFWERVASNLGCNVGEPDEPDFDDPQLRLEPCPVCGSTEACGTDYDGRPMIHTTPPEENQ